MMLIPILPIPAQVFNVTLGSQVCQISIYQKSTGLFLDLSVNSNVVITCQLGLNRVLLVRQTYLGFIGDLSFIDTQGLDDPTYLGLGARFILVYLTPGDVEMGS